MRQLGAAIIWLLIQMLPPCFAADAPRPRSIVVLVQSDTRGPFFGAVLAGIRDAADGRGEAAATIYTENLDLTRFRGADYEASLAGHLATKYAERPIGAIIAIGVESLRFLKKNRATLWPEIHVVFGFVPDSPEARALLTPEMTGTFSNVGFNQMVVAARAIIPDLEDVILVGQAWNDNAVFGHWRDDVADANAGLTVTDWSHLQMPELRNRVASLPDRSAILYSAVYSDGAGAYIPPAHALSLLAASANRPIIIATETFLGHGGVGGFVLQPDVIGQDAGRLAMRILDGEAPSGIPLASGKNLKPIFDWRQMQRWNVAASSLPDGSEIRFRMPNIWEQYRWQSLTAVSIILFQASLITLMLYERQRRHLAEIEARRRMSELAHLNRQATAGEMSASIAHELNQPLAAILNNAEAAECLLKSATPDLKEIGEILTDIRRDDTRASEMIKHLRGLLKKSEFEPQLIDINDTFRNVFRFLSVQALIRDVMLETDLWPAVLLVRGDSIQLEQVVLNLVMNGIDAVADQSRDRRRVIGRTEFVDGAVLVSVVDFGQGIQVERLARVFDPFFTTKEQGMGVGLSIARTIVEAHRGRIWAENRPGGGAVFRVSLQPASVDKDKHNKGQVA